jgi:hypothetical protein
MSGASPRAAIEILESTEPDLPLPPFAANRETLMALMAAACVAPHRIGAEVASGLFAALRAPGVCEEVWRMAVLVLQSLLSGPAAADVCATLLAGLSEPGRDPRFYQTAAEALQFAASWCHQFLDPGNLRPPIELSPAARIVQPLGEGRRRVLIVQNIRDAQGDEIIRVVALMQALLASNPRMDIVLITGRQYLYANSRVLTVPPTAGSVIRQQLASGFDAVIDFYEGNVPSVNYDTDLEKEIQSYRRTGAPELFLAGDKGYNRFTFHTVEFDGRNYAQELGLDRQRVNNVYETTLRLITALGFPARTGRDAPEPEPVLAGIEWPLAAAEWRRLTGRNTEHRPVALLNPFGGGEPLKGYVIQQSRALASRIRSLVEEGFFVIVCPNGTPWGCESGALELLDTLDSAVRRFVAIAPDAGSSRPDGPGYATSGLSYADTVTRLLTYFVRFATLIVAVEGWMIHAAYCLGKPYRILMMAYSHPPEWHPYPQARDQQIEWPVQVCASDNGDFLDGFLFEQPRKQVFVGLLRELGECGDPQAVPFLQRAAASLDRDVRTAAVQALAQMDGPAVEACLTRLIGDPWYRVRAAAAAALLPRSPASLRDELLAHVLIGAAERDWKRILALGQAALPALERATCDEDAVVRREAGWALEFLREVRTPIRRRDRRGWRSLLPSSFRQPDRRAQS